MLNNALLQAYDLCFLIGKSYFSNDESKNYLIFQSIVNTFKRLTGTETIVAWESKGWSPETIDMLPFLIVFSPKLDGFMIQELSPLMEPSLPR